MSDPYLIPGTFVLKNKLGITDGNLLQQHESNIAGIRTYEFLESGRKIQVSMQSWKTIHKLLFRDVYDWAGQYRNIYISKENDRGITRFLPFERITTEGNKAMDHMKSVLRHASSENLDKILSSLADVYLEMNYIHPFREGNGRSQKLFFECTLAQYGIDLDWSKVSRDLHIEAAVAGGLGSPSLMRDQFQIIGTRVNNSDITLQPRP